YAYATDIYPPGDTTVDGDRTIAEFVDFGDHMLRNAWSKVSGASLNPDGSFISGQIGSVAQPDPPNRYTPEPAYDGSGNLITSSDSSDGFGGTMSSVVTSYQGYQVTNLVGVIKFAFDD